MKKAFIISALSILTFGTLVIISEVSSCSISQENFFKDRNGNTHQTRHKIFQIIMPAESYGKLEQYIFFTQSDKFDTTKYGPNWYNYKGLWDGIYVNNFFEPKKDPYVLYSYFTFPPDTIFYTR